MHRFIPNRLWTLIMVFGLLLGASAFSPATTWADDNTNVDQSENGDPIGMGDPDSPEGGTKGGTPTAPGIAPRPRPALFRLSFVGDEGSTADFMIWRLRVLLQSLGRTWYRF
jgi:hypothetical protein